MTDFKEQPRNDFSIPEEYVARSSQMVPHDKLQRTKLTGSLELAATTLEPVHVGSGSFELLDHLVKEIVRRRGRPVIPGTSLKGMCRQIHEVLTSSPAPFKDKLESGQKYLGSSASLFGALGYQGRISFDDVELPEGCEPVEVLVSVPYKPQRKAGRRFYESFPEGTGPERTIPILAIPAKTNLVACLRFRNVTRGELGGVLLSLGVGRFAPRLGGGKYNGYGQMRFEVRRFRLREGITWGTSHREEEPEAVAAFVQSCIEAFQLTDVGRDALELLTRRLSPAEVSTES